jgi:hypothetical protein
VQSQSRNQNGPAVPVIARVRDLLKIERAVYAPPEMNIIIPLEDVFPPIPKSSVAQEKSQTAEFQIFLMVSGYRINSCRQKY